MTEISELNDAREPNDDGMTDKIILSKYASVRKSKHIGPPRTAKQATSDLRTYLALVTRRETDVCTAMELQAKPMQDEHEIDISTQLVIEARAALGNAYEYLITAVHASKQIRKKKGTKQDKAELSDVLGAAEISLRIWGNIWPYLRGTLTEIEEAELRCYGYPGGDCPMYQRILRNKLGVLYLRTHPTGRRDD